MYGILMAYAGSMPVEIIATPGALCKACGKGLRFVSSWKCVPCARGASTREGKECKVCGKTKRYIKNNCCVHCTSERKRLSPGRVLYQDWKKKMEGVVYEDIL